MKYIDYLNKQNIENNDERISTFKLTLEDEAREWVEGKVFQNLDDLKTRFLTRFSGLQSRDACIAALRLAELSPGETVEDFVRRLRVIIESLGTVTRFSGIN